jgi:mono/diheme cytochrome c family protein
MSIRIPVASKATAAAGWAIVTCAAIGAPFAYAHQGHGVGHAPKPTPEEIAAFERAKPAFERHCFRCHTSAGKKAKPKALAHITMDGYPFGGHHADESGNVVRKVLGAGGGKPTMPSDDRGAVTGEDLARILAWADAFENAHPAPKDEETKEKADAH